MLSYAVVGVTLRASPTAAQDFDPIFELRETVAPTARSSLIRVQLEDARLVTGTLTDATADGIAMLHETGLHMTIPYGDIVRFWERRRSVARGAARFGFLGAVAGAALGALWSAACENECDPLGGEMLRGSVYVGAAGAAAGGLIGAAVPRWDLRWSQLNAAPGPDPVPAPPVDDGAPGPEAGVVPPPRIGEVTFQLLTAYGGSSGIDDGVIVLPEERGVMGGASAALGFRLGRFALGPELVVLGGSPGLLAVSGAARFDMARSRVNTPYVTLGIGGYAWQGSASAQDVLLTLSAGFGITFGDGRWRAEARWHPVVHHTDTSWEPSLVTIGTGRRFAW